MFYKDPVNGPSQEKPERVWIPINGTQWTVLISIGAVLLFFIGCFSLMIAAVTEDPYKDFDREEVRDDFDTEEAVNCLMFLSAVELARKEGRSDAYILDKLDNPTIRKNGLRWTERECERRYQ